MAITLLAGACDGNDDGDTASDPLTAPGESEAPARPEVTFAAGGENIEVPDSVPSGFVDIRVKGLEGNGGAHFLLARINDGVTDEQLDAAIASAGEEFFGLVDVVGGNGTIAAGDETLMTLELAEGNHIAINIYFTSPEAGPSFAIDRFVVVDEGNEATAPADKGTVNLGPDMRIAVPDGFDATGVWRFENRDGSLTHEAAMVRLASGATAEDVVNWFHTQEGPPPIEGEFGSMGAIGPGNEAWIDFDASPLDPGEYAMVCFLPGADGLPHVFNGMIAQITVGGPGT
jgi:hypothetical protein